MATIGLALSGGGFRATLFHLGVVRFLYEANMLKDVKHVTSVSGGSILAAHLVLNWERYTGTQAEFAAAAGELVQFTRRDLRGRVVRPWLVSALCPPVPVALSLPRWLWSSRFTRTSLLRQGYEWLFRGARLRDLAKPGRPQLHVLATSMTTGHMAAFEDGRVRLTEGAGSEGLPAKYTDLPAASLPVSYAVAASSAFPPLFPPVLLDAAELGVSEGDFPAHYSHFLCDGGVFDNLGLRRLFQVKHAAAAGEHIDVVVISDAQRRFTLEFGEPYNLLPFRSTRCVDLMMDRLSRFERQDLSSDLPCQIDCKLTTRLDEMKTPYAPTEGVQSALQDLRTDLDRFEPAEINALVHHGWAVARSDWEPKHASGMVPFGSSLRGDMPWTPVEPRPGGKYELIPPTGYNASALARVTSVCGMPYRFLRKAGLMRLNHWATWAFWMLLLGYFVSVSGTVAGVVLWQDQQKKIAREKADDERIAKEAAEKEKEEVERKYQDAVRHVDRKIRLVNRMAQIALARPGDEMDAAKRDWRRFWEDVSSDWWFARHRKKHENEKFMRFEDAHEGSVALRQMTYDHADYLRGVIEDANDVPEENRYLQVLLERRPDWYSEVERLTRRLAEGDIDDLALLRSTQNRFWSLYLAEMTLIEGGKVAAAMKLFSVELEAWEKLEQEKQLAPAKRKDRLKAIKRELASRATDVATACNTEMKSRRPTK